MYKRVMVPSYSIITHLVPGSLLGTGGMVERRKLGRVFGLLGKTRLVLDLMNLAEVKVLCRSLEV